MRWPRWLRRRHQAHVWDAANSHTAAVSDALERAQRDYREAVLRRVEVERLAAEVRRALGAP